MSDPNTTADVFSEEQIQWLKENLLLSASTNSHYTYTGDEGSMYTDYTEITLSLCGEVISSVSFNG